MMKTVILSYHIVDFYPGDDDSVGDIAISEYGGGCGRSFGNGSGHGFGFSNSVSNGEGYGDGPGNTEGDSNGYGFGIANLVD